MTASLLLVLPLVLPAFVDDGDDQYQLIVGLAEKGFAEMVVKEATSFLEGNKKHPKATLAQYRLGTALFDLGRFDEARTHFSALAAERGFEFGDEVVFRLGQCELERGKHGSAAEAFRKLVSKGGGYLATPANFLLGEALFREGDFSAAETQYEKTLRAADAGDYAKDAAHGLAWCAYRLERYDQAAERIRRFLSEWPRDERAGEMRFVLGETHLEAGRPEDALAAYERVGAGPFHDAALRGAGFASAALGRHANATTWFERLLEDYPESRFVEEAALHRGIQYLKGGDPARAIEALSARGVGEGAEVQYWRGRAFADAGDPKRALKAIDRALAAEPDSELAGRLHVARGDVLFGMGRKGEAAEAFERAGSDYALHAAAVARLNEGAHAEAVRLAERLLDPKRDSAYRNEARLTLAEGLFGQGDYTRAREVFEEILAKDDDQDRQARAAVRRGWCSFLTGEVGDAAQRFREAVRAFPQSPEAAEALFMSGRASEASEDPTAARQAYASYLARFETGEHRGEATLRLARLEPGDAGLARLRTLLDEGADPALAPQLHYELGERLMAAGDTENAQGSYRAVVEDYPESDLCAAATYGLAWCQYSSGEFESAAQRLNALVKERDLEAEMRLVALELLVWTERKAGNPNGARKAYTQFAGACDDEARRFQAAKATAGALKESERLADADRILADLLERTRDRGVAVGICIERAYLALDGGRAADAEAQLRAAHRHAPDDPELAEAFFFAGEALFDSGADEEAAELYEIAAQTASADVAQRALYKGGFALLRKGDLDAAARRFRALVEQHGGSELYGESLFLLGESHYRAGRFEQAAQWLSRVRREVPAHEVAPKALFRLGVARCRMEAWQPAAEALSELAREFPDFENGVEAELWRGRALANSSQRRGARQAFARVIEQDRGVLSAQARIELGRLALAAGERDDALSEFLKVAVLYAHEEEVAEALFMAGQVLEAQEDPERAAAQYREAVEKHPKAKFAKPARERLNALKP